MAQKKSQEIIVPRNNQFYRSLAFVFPALMFFPGRHIFRHLSVENIEWDGKLIGSCIVFLLLAYLFSQILQRILNQKPALIISKKGLTDNISMVRAGLIPWNRIQRVSVEKYTGQEQLLIEVKNPEDIVERQNYFKKNMAKQMIRDTGCIISVNPKMIKYDLKKLQSQIQRRKK